MLLTFRKTVLLAMFFLLCRMSMGWIFEEDIGVALSEGDSCRIQTGEPGICKRIDTCEPYYEGLRKKTIEYSFLVRCSLIGFVEVICCPETSPGWVRQERTEENVAPTATTTSTTTTTTTIRPIVIGDITITGDDKFVDLSQIIRRTSSTTTTTPRPRQSRLEPMQPNNAQQNVNWVASNQRNEMFPGAGINVQWPNQQIQRPIQQAAEWFNPLAVGNNQQQGQFQNTNRIPQQQGAEWFNPLAPGGNQQRGQFSQNMVQFPLQPAVPNFRNSNRRQQQLRRQQSMNWFNPLVPGNNQQQGQFQNPNSIPQQPQQQGAEWFNPLAPGNNQQQGQFQNTNSIPQQPQQQGAEWFNPLALGNNQQQGQFQNTNSIPQQPQQQGAESFNPLAPGNNQQQGQFQNTNSIPQQPQQQGAEWINPLAPGNSQGQFSQNPAQIPLQPAAASIQNTNSDPLNDLLGPFQFRPNPDDAILAGSSTLRTINSNDLSNESTDEWSWSAQTTPRVVTTVTTTPTPDWVKPILPDWMKDTLSSSSTTTTTPSPRVTESNIPDWINAALNTATTTTTTTTSTTPRSQVTETSLPDWMQAALNSAPSSSSSIPTATPRSIPVIPISVTSSTTEDPDIDIRITRRTANPTSTVRTVATRNENERPSQAACREYNNLNPSGLTFHILDGVPVAPGDFPHMGGLIYESGGGNDIDVRCGTSLISDRYTLTAAHCANDELAQPIRARFGVVILSSADDDIVPLDVDIESISLHPDYRAQFRYHDVAVIRLRTAVKYTPYIRPACLYSDLGDVNSNTPLAVIGWGVTNVQTRTRSGVLLAANLTSVPLDQCNRTHLENGVSRSYKNGLNEGQYCAFDVALQKDACQADSGGPLQLVQNQHSTIVGIVSFGLSCGSAVPSVYARVAYYLNWIETVVWPQS